LGKAIQPEQFEREMKAFFAGQPKVGQQEQLALDGKQIRGTAATSEPLNKATNICWACMCREPMSC
jgi:hypothetical protein